MKLTKEECWRLLELIPNYDGDHVNASIRRKVNLRLKLANWDNSKTREVTND